MATIREKMLSFRHICYKNGYLFAAFLIPVAIMCIAYITFRIFPFGERSVLALDLNAQYVFYYDYVHDVIGNGESLMYSWSRNLSGEFMGIIGYYLASPFSLIVWLFPRSMITEGLLAMMLAKFGTCGVTFALFAHKSQKLEKKTAALFAPMYALCAYMIVQTMNPMWLDCVIALPLVCWGIDSLIKENRFRLLVGSLVYSFVSNFYIGFMVAIFATLYFICRYFSLETYVGNTAENVARRFCVKGVFFGICGVVSAMMSAFMLLPVYNSLQNGKFSFTEPDYSFVTSFDIADVSRKLFANSYDTVRMEGLPFIFCGSVALVLAAGFFCCKAFSFKKKLASGVLIALLVVSMYVRPVDMMWHGGQMPNWLPYRYSFMLSFIIVALAAHCFEHLKLLKAKTIGAITLCYIALIIYIQSTDTVIAELGDGGREVFDGITVALPAIAFVAVAGICVYAIKRIFKGKSLTKTGVIAVTSVICAELCFNATSTLNKMHRDITFSTRDSYLSVILPLREKVEQIKSKDDGFYRIEKNFFRSVNDPMAANMYGLSHSSSTLNSKAIDMLGYFGFTSNGHYSRFSGNTPLTCDIFGVKYILDSEGSTTSTITSADDISVTENLDALPIGFLANGKVSNLELSEYDVFDNQDNLLNALTGVYREVFDVFSADGIPYAENCIKGSFEKQHIGFTNPTGEASVTYTITVPDSGEVYMYLPTDYEREASLYVNGEYKGICFESDNHNIKDLGRFEQGEEVEIKLVLRRSDLYFREPQFAVYNEEAEKSAIAKLWEKNSETKVEKLSQTDIRFTVNASANDVLFTTIPAEKGWTVYVDGNAVEYGTALNDALMTVELTEGEHIVEFKFFAAGLGTGIILTVCGILIFVGMILLYLKIKKPVRLTAIKNNASDIDKTDSDDIINISDTEQTEAAFPEETAAEGKDDNTE